MSLVSKGDEEGGEKAEAKAFCQCHFGGQVHTHTTLSPGGLERKRVIPSDAGKSAGVVP